MADSERSLRDDSLRRNRGGGVLTIHSPTESPVCLLSNNLNSVIVSVLKRRYLSSFKQLLRIDGESIKSRSIDLRLTVSGGLCTPQN